MAERTFQKEEIKQVLERAVELQAAAASQEGEEGLTMEELEHVAETTGLDPRFVRQAVVELEAPPEVSTPPSATHIFAERHVPGRLNDEAWEDVLIELRRRFETSTDEAHEEEEQYGSTRSWTHVNAEEVETKVYITTRDDGTHVRLSQHISSARPVYESGFWAIIATVVLGSLASSLVEGTLLSVAAYVLALLVTWPGLYLWDVNWRQSKQRELDELADLLASRLHAKQPRAERTQNRTRQEAEGSDVRPDASLPDIDLDELSPPEAREQLRRDRRRQSGSSS